MENFDKTMKFNYDEIPKKMSKQCCKMSIIR